MKFASVVSSTATADEDGMGIDNLLVMAPRSQSSERSPNGMEDGQSCVRFTEFPAKAVFDLGGTALVS